MDIAKIDTNLASGKTGGADIEWISSFDKRISLHGVFYDEKASSYRRVPEDVAAKTLNPGVVALSSRTAGVSELHIGIKSYPEREKIIKNTRMCEKSHVAGVFIYSGSYYPAIVYCKIK